MQVKRILFPTDFSEHSEAALHHATSLARDAKATLLIVHVQEPMDSFADTGFAGYPTADDQAELQKRLDEIAPSDPNVPFTRQLVRGYPADEIARLAEEEAVDMVVMGTHGRTGLTRLLMGSVAEAVVRRAGCPVLTIRQPEKRKAATS